ncbi:MAG: SufD family Fe-S cluster assembly protein [Candidatus Cryosericum sp.]|nr:SufD family Fe-S cluster assembly protein [bacterium]
MYHGSRQRRALCRQEAAAGKIVKDEVEYLMFRGITESDAVSLIIRGFIDLTVQGLRPNL